MEQHTGPDPSKIMQIGMGFWASKGLLAAVKFGLFTSLAGTSKKAAEIKKELKLGTTDRHVFDWLHVIVPEGIYIINGPVHLLSNVDLHLEEGSILKFGTNADNYTPLVKVRWEGVIIYNYSPLVYACRQKNIAITGTGIIDGQTDGTWSEWLDRNNGNNQHYDQSVSRQMGNDVIPEEQRVFGNGYNDINGDGKDDGFGDGKHHYLRPDLIEFFECENILMDGVTLKQSPFWTLHPIFCKNVTLRNLNIAKGASNDDGIDPESSSYVLIENCNINTNDDAIAIKAGRDQDAWRLPGTDNIVVRNCVFRSQIANGFCIGSEMSGGVKNVFMENCHSTFTDNGINFKCNLDRGGYIHDVYIRNYIVDSSRTTGILLQMDYHMFRGGHYPPDFRRFYLSNIIYKYVKGKPISIVGVENKHAARIFLNNILIVRSEHEADIRFADEVVKRNVFINGKAVQ